MIATNGSKPIRLSTINNNFKKETIFASLKDNQYRRKWYIQIGQILYYTYKKHSPYKSPQ